MKMGQSFRCIFWATLYCVLYLVTATDEDLMDFDFGDLKDVDWNYDNQNSQELFTKSTTKPEENSITFDDDLDLLDDQDEKVHPFDWREKLLRTAMSKALRNKAVRQKFIEVMPILRVLSRQQKLALSALITAQISAKKGHELKLDQVRMMFGDDKSLILPVVYDIANLIKNSAKKYIEFDYTLQDLANFAKPKAEADRRKLELSSVELSDDDNTVGVATLPYTANESKEDEMDDFMDAGEEEEEYLDPMEINKELQKAITGKPQLTTEHIPIMVADKKKKITETKETSQEVIVDDPIKINMELQKDVPTLELLKGSVPIPSSEKLIISKTTPTPLRRTRRATENRELIHKLVRSVPLSVNEADLQRGLAGRTLKLNTTAFASPKESTLKPTTTAEPTAETILPNGENLEPYQLVEDLAFASLNGSEILLSGDEESKTEDDVTPDTDEPQGETLPTPEELIAGPRYRISANKIINMRSSGSSPKGKRVLAKTRGRPVKGSGVLPPKKCERFTASMCIRTEDYPIDQIMGSIRRHRNAMTALLAEYNDKQPHGLDSSDGFDDYFHSNKRREDTNEVQGGLCQSIVRYARPQKARSASGEWKFIVNTGQHTQTLRLEKCTNPQESCSYLSSNYKSYCSQVYNYHRLLSWDKTRGLHVDIFKVPTCCSCQINGMKQQQFAAVLSSYTKKDFSPVHNREKYHHDTRDYAEDVEEDDDDEEFGFSISGHNHYDANELQSGSSKRVRSKLPSPTVGSYLSPPGDDEFEQYPYKIPRDTASVYKSSPSGTSLSSSSSTVGSSKKILRDLARRRPQKSFSSDYQQADLEYAPSEQHVQREAVATTALRPSPQAPEPFVPSRQALAQQQEDLSLIPMPTKSHHHHHLEQAAQQTVYQQRSPAMEPLYSNHQYPTLAQQQHHQLAQHHYQPITTPMHQEMVGTKSTGRGYGSHLWERQPATPKRALPQRQSPKRLNTSRRHRSARLYLL
ncbi:neurotrophin 1 isoform X2 [Haematobia irritans]|uniref:neurotrophin 1 isoform X2 n=1 Tax=Haematobia irritans TaxID=7368 RepID=UPI003F4F6F3E